MRFHVIDDACVILRSRGVYRQAKVYYRGAELYAGWAGGFVSLLGNGGTSKPDMSWLGLYGVTYREGRLGRPELSELQKLKAAE